MHRSGTPGRRCPRGGRGASRFGVLVFLLILGGLAYLASLYIPPYWTYLSMQDPVKEAAMSAGRGGEAKARAELLARARDLGLALEEEAVEFVQDGPEQVVRVDWAVPIELPRYVHTLRFHIEKRSPLP
ncbi:MAG: hypothetical protein ACE147_09155 [Candidatus Methylomirabilales bacterium]